MTNFFKAFSYSFCFFSVLCLFLSATPSPSYAQNQVKKAGSVTGLNIPRFVSLRSSEAYVRSGPGRRYPIRWIFQRKNMPVEVIQEFDTWRKIRDYEGNEGWVHTSLTSGRRYGLVLGKDIISAHYKAHAKTATVYRAEPGVVVKLNECEDDWCNASTSGFDGWIEKKMIWGIYPGEGIN